MLSNNKCSSKFIFLFIISISLSGILSYEDYYEINICSPETCPYPSLCISKTTCKCKDGFYNTNFDINDYSNKCNYKMKSSNSPFWVEIITNIGIGHMMIGNHKIGIFKLFYIITTLCFFYYVCMSEKNSQKNLNDNYHLVINAINLILCFGVLLWWLIDAICFGINKYKDSNGIKLYDY